MNRDFFHEFLTQLACRIPSLFACVVGIALSAAFVRRSPRSCFLAMGAAVLLIATLVGHAFLLSVDPPFEDDATYIDVVTLVSDGLQSIAILLLFAAVLLGRQPPHTSMADFLDD